MIPKSSNINKLKLPGFGTQWLTQIWAGHQNASSVYQSYYSLLEKVSKDERDILFFSVNISRHLYIGLRQLERDKRL